MRDRVRHPDPYREAVDTITIGELAATGGVHVETIRYYERRGLLPAPARSTSGYRQYVAADVWRLRFILRAKALGFTLREIAELLGADGSEARAVEDVGAVTRRRLAAVDDEIAALTRRRADLTTLLRTCEGGDEADCLGLALPAPGPG
jgi:MerR family mercuric resistance operon transcriptional regulator